MTKIHHLPHVDLPPEPLEPETDAERADRLETENRILRAYLNDVDKLVQRVLALRTHRGKLLWIAVGVAAAYILAIATPFDEQLAGLLKRVFAGNEVAQSHRPAPEHSSLTTRVIDSRQVPAPTGEPPGGPTAPPPSSLPAKMDPLLPGVRESALPGVSSAHIPPGCLLHGVRQVPCRPTSSPLPSSASSPLPASSDPR